MSQKKIKNLITLYCIIQENNRLKPRNHISNDLNDFLFISFVFLTELYQKNYHDLRFSMSKKKIFILKKNKYVSVI